MSSRSNESLDHQLRELRDADGTPWLIRIEQGGGVPGNVPDAAPVAVLIFRAVDVEPPRELRITGKPGAWELEAYSEKDLRAFLREAQAHAAHPAAD